MLENSFKLVNSNIFNIWWVCFCFIMECIYFNIRKVIKELFNIHKHFHSFCFHFLKTKMFSLLFFLFNIMTCFLKTIHRIWNHCRSLYFPSINSINFKLVVYSSSGSWDFNIKAYVDALFSWINQQYFDVQNILMQILHMDNYYDNGEKIKIKITF